jgi:hypothetical protein
MKNSNDIIDNRTRDLPTCSAVPQPTAPPAACTDFHVLNRIFKVIVGGKREILSESFNGTPAWIWQQRPPFRRPIKVGITGIYITCYVTKTQQCYLLVVDNEVSPRYVWLHRRLVRFDFIAGKRHNYQCALSNDIFRKIFKRRVYGR